MFKLGIVYDIEITEGILICGPANAKIPFEFDNDLYFIKNK